MLKLYRATRYVVPLREGGSLPAVVDTDEAGLFVLKFRGAARARKPSWRSFSWAPSPEGSGFPCRSSPPTPHLESYVGICRGDAKAGPIALLPPSERFHWLTHPRSAIIQTSATHPGRCPDMEAELHRLLEEQCHSG